MAMALQAMDTVLIGMLIVFAVWGFANGFIRAVGAIVGIVIGAAFASRYYLFFADIIGPVFGPYHSVAVLASYAFLFLIVARLFGFVVAIVEKAFDLLAIIPFLKTINRFLGAAFGVIFGVLFLGTLLFIIGKYSHWTAFNDAVVNSPTAQQILTVSRPVRLLYPSDLLALQSYF